MENVTQRLKKMVKSRKNQKIIYKNSKKRQVGLFVDDLSVK
jgi:hypothetical protein